MTERRSGFTRVAGMDGVTEIYGLCQYEGRSYAATDQGLYCVDGNMAALVRPMTDVNGYLAKRETEYFVALTLGH